MHEPLAQEDLPKGNLLSRLFKPRVGWMFVRNTVVSTAVFVIFGLGLLWLLVEWAGVDTVIATGISFVSANTAHYILGRTWIFRGTERGVASGYALFLINGMVGLAITMGSMALLLEHTPVNYLVARIMVSVIAGLTIFVLNAVWNFRRV